MALALFLGGCGALLYMLFFAAGWRGIVLIACGFVATMGAMWLYSDFIDATPSDQGK